MPLPRLGRDISSCTHYSRRRAPLDHAPVIQSCAARRTLLHARLAKQSVNARCLCNACADAPRCSEACEKWFGPLPASSGEIEVFSLVGSLCQQLAFVLIPDGDFFEHVWTGVAVENELFCEVVPN